MPSRLGHDVLARRWSVGGAGCLGRDALCGARCRGVCFGCDRLGGLGDEIGRRGDDRLGLGLGRREAGRGLLLAFVRFDLGIQALSRAEATQQVGRLCGRRRGAAGNVGGIDGGRAGSRRRREGWRFDGGDRCIGAERQIWAFVRRLGIGRDTDVVGRIDIDGRRHGFLRVNVHARLDGGCCVDRGVRLDGGVERVHRLGLALGRTGVAIGSDSGEAGARIDLLEVVGRLS